MAKRKRSGRPPQARHGKKSKPSRHDKRKRLDRRNPNRRRTKRAKVPLVGLIAALAAKMAALLDRRNGFRLPIILAGAMLAGSRRTASRWFEAAGVADDWDRFYDLLVAVGKNASPLMVPLLSHLVQKLDPGPEGHWTIAIDDSPTKRFGRHVEAANTHHNPTPGPADGPWLYGHNWVCLALLMRHPLWGVLALPVLSKLYVRRADVAELKERYDWKFCTKHELALQLIRKVVGCLRALGSKAGVTVVVDGAFAVRPFLLPLVKEGIRVVSRLRRDAKLFDLPPQPTDKRGRGRPPIYGKNRLSLAKRAGRQDGWETVTYRCRGVDVTRRCKTFLATSQLVSGVIRVVLVEYERGAWAPYFSTDPKMSAQQILETVADRWAIEECFHDVKEIWGAGQQQVRNVWSNIGCWHLNTWLYAMVELASWDAPADDLVDRRGRSWDNPDRRPSHADRRRKIMREMLENHFLADLPDGPEGAKFRARINELLCLAA
jgi:hypothetical protein